MRGHLALAAAVVAALVVPGLAHGAPPPNDDFAAATQLVGASGTVVGSTVDATSEPGEPASLARNHSIWYAWTAPAYGILSFDTFGTTYAWVFTGDALDGLELKINGQAYGFVSVRAGVTYRIALDDWSSGGPTQLSWTFEETPPPPANDDWESAAALAGTSGTVELDTTGATRQSCDPHLGYGRTLWYRWTAPADGELMVLPDLTNHGTIAAVFTGDSLCALYQRAYSGGDPAYADVVVGETYWIAVDTWGSFGATAFSWSFEQVTRPANDLFGSAEDLGPSYRGAIQSTTFRATSEPGEHSWWGRTVWYSWTPAESGVASVDLHLADGRVYTGDSLATLTTVASLGGRFPVTAGTTYYVQIESSGRGGDFVLEWLLEPDRAPANDAFAAATPLDALGGRVEATNKLATLEAGEPAHGGKSNASVWFAWTAPADGTATFRVDSSFWTIHAVYTGDSVDALARVEQTQDVAAQVVSFEAAAGTTYRIAVDGRAGGTGIFWLEWSLVESSPPPPPPSGSAPEPGSDRVTTREDEPLAIAPRTLLANDSDPDGDDLTLVAVSADKRTSGSVFLSKGRIVFTPNENFNGTTRFFYTVADPEGLEATAAVVVRVLPVNDAPTVTLTTESPTLAEGGTVQLTAYAEDVEGDELAFEWSSTDGVVTGDGPSATLAVDDGPASVEVTVTAFDAELSSSAVHAIDVVNVAPSVEAQDAGGVWGVPVSVTGSATDPSRADTLAGLAPSWAIGGGAVAALTATHVFEAPGSYTASLTVSDKDGGTGSRDVAIQIGKRASTLAYTGDATVPFGFGTAAARLGDGVDAATARLDGRAVEFVVGGTTIGATTTNGVASAAFGAALLPGAYAVEARFAEDGLYLASAATGSVTVVNSAGKVTGGVTLSDGTVVELNASHDGTRTSGSLTAGSFTASEIAALGISGRGAWLAGTGTDGRPFRAYVEDNGEPGRGSDVFRLWIAGEPVAGGGVVADGNVKLHK